MIKAVEKMYSCSIVDQARDLCWSKTMLRLDEIKFSRQISILLLVNLETP